MKAEIYEIIRPACTSEESAKETVEKVFNRLAKMCIDSEETIFEHYNETKPTLEFLINGKKFKYDACSTRSDLETAKLIFGNNFIYLGSSDIFLINGKKNVSEKDMHFFIRVKQ